MLLHYSGITESTEYINKMTTIAKSNYTCGIRGVLFLSQSESPNRMIILSVIILSSFPWIRIIRNASLTISMKSGIIERPTSMAPSFLFVAGWTSFRYWVKTLLRIRSTSSDFDAPDVCFTKTWKHFFFNL